MLAWTGPRLSFNSCLPAHVSVYKHLPYTPPTPAEGETETRVVHVRKAIPQDESMKIYKVVTCLPFPGFLTDAASSLHHIPREGTRAGIEQHAQQRLYSQDIRSQ